VKRRGAAAALLLLAAGLARAESAAPQGSLTGEEIYARVIEHRLRSFSEESRRISADRTGREQETRLRMHWKDFRNARGEPRDGVLSKAIVRYTTRIAARTVRAWRTTWSGRREAQATPIASAAAAANQPGSTALRASGILRPSLGDPEGFSGRGAAW
jgi:hypothetical protein